MDALAVESIKKALDAPDFDVHEEVEKAEEIQEMIRAGNEALGDICEHFRLANIALSEDTIHILTDNAYSRLFPEKKNELACFRDGHMFMRQSRDRVALMSDFTHELAHAISYNQIRISVTENTETELHFDSRQKRTGYGFENARKELRTIGASFNEGVTEFFARDVVRPLFAEYVGLNDKESKGLEDEIAYYPQYVLIRGILQYISEQGKEPSEEDFLRGLITGEKTVLKKLHQSLKELGFEKGVKPLIEMGFSTEDVLAVATHYRLEAAEMEIQNFDAWETLNTDTSKLRDADRMNLKERIEKAKKEARSLAEAEKESLEIGHIINDFVHGKIGLQEFIQNEKRSELLEPGEIEFTNLDEMRAFLADFLKDDALAQELTNHEKEHLDVIMKTGWPVRILFRFFRDEKGVLFGRPGVEPTIPEIGDEEDIREKLKRIIESPHDLSDTDTLAIKPK